MSTSAEVVRGLRLTVERCKRLMFTLSSKRVQDRVCVRRSRDENKASTVEIYGICEKYMN